MRLCILFLSIQLVAFGAFNAGAHWDIQTTGLDTNGGAFDATVSAPGTDESQGAGTAITVTLVTGTTGVCSITCTSTTHGPGNFIHIASGAGCTTGWFEVLSQAAGTITVDHTMGSSTNACVGTFGGSMLTLAAVITPAVAYNTVYIQSGTYTITTDLNVGSTQALAFTGYQTAHDDNPTGTNRPLITTSTNSVSIFANTGNNSSFANLRMSSTAGTPKYGLWAQSYYVHNITLLNVKMSGFSVAISGDATPDFSFINLQLDNVEIDCGTTGILSTNGATLVNSYIHGCSGNGLDTSTKETADFDDASGFFITHSVFANNNHALAFSSGRTNHSALIFLFNSTFYNSTSDHITLANQGAAIQAAVLLWENNIFDTSGGYVFNSSYSGVQFQVSLRYNAYRANTSGLSNITLRTPEVAPITLTVDPFTNAAGGDFSLNNTAGGGAAVRAAGDFFPGGTTTNYQDVGATQHSGAPGTVTVGVPVF